MSRTYIEWAKRNLALNDLAGPEHGFVPADCLVWLEEQRQKARRWDVIFVDPPTHSRSKRMTEDFDVQRDHVKLLNLARDVLAPDGVIVFSNNYTRFKLDREQLAGFEVEDVTRRTVPRDFERNPRIHSCFELRLRTASGEFAAARSIDGAQRAPESRGTRARDPE
jgi:23S rRNA (guanine2069-N7)-methyltransferase / 23S rRNA (guanine2445-N2)-methyltransferase